MQHASVLPALAMISRSMDFFVSFRLYLHSASLVSLNFTLESSSTPCLEGAGFLALAFPLAFDLAAFGAAAAAGAAAGSPPPLVSSMAGRSLTDLRHRYCYGHYMAQHTRRNLQNANKQLQLPEQLGSFGTAVTGKWQNTSCELSSFLHDLCLRELCHDAVEEPFSRRQVGIWFAA